MPQYTPNQHNNKGKKSFGSEVKDLDDSSLE
jgi:hypothetical protein